METFQLCLLILKCDILVYVKYYINGIASFHTDSLREL